MHWFEKMGVLYLLTVQIYCTSTNGKCKTHSQVISEIKRKYSVTYILPTS